uniref:Uncharacterized protein n=1 Tax=Anguilla anguilla TaxID=7936 RepID=A0A0E9PJU6_ANGAN
MCFFKTYYVGNSIRAFNYCVLTVRFRNGIFRSNRQTRHGFQEENKTLDSATLSIVIPHKEKSVPKIK